MWGITWSSDLKHPHENKPYYPHENNQKYFTIFVTCRAVPNRLIRGQKYPSPQKYRTGLLITPRTRFRSAHGAKIAHPLQIFRVSHLLNLPAWYSIYSLRKHQVLAQCLQSSSSVKSDHEPNYLSVHFANHPFKRNYGLCIAFFWINWRF